TDRGAVFRLISRFHPGVDQRVSDFIDPQAGGVFGADGEFVLARLWGQDRAFPADRKLIRVKLHGRRAGLSEVEPDSGINPIEDALLIPEAPGFEVLPVQPMKLIPTAG